MYKAHVPWESVLRERDLLARTHQTSFAVNLYEVNETTKSVVLEYVGDKRVTDILTQRMTSLEKKALANSTLTGIQFLNSLGVAHRDIHEKNVMVRDEEWSVVFVDFMDGCLTNVLEEDDFIHCEYLKCTLVVKDMRDALELAGLVSGKPYLKRTQKDCSDEEACVAYRNAWLDTFVSNEELDGLNARPPKLVFRSK